ncbi:MAG: hypothetical protein KBF78_05730 [Fuscovulum sp.]|nr:hypothetical protein [Fuscovulum sp.]
MASRKPPADAAPPPLLRFEAGFQRFDLYRGWDLSAALARSADLAEVPWSAALDNRLDGLLSDADHLASLRGLMLREDGPKALAARTEVADWLRRQLASGQLRLAARPLRHGTHRPSLDPQAQVEKAAAVMQAFLSRPREVAEPEPAPAPLPERHWIEIELLDEDDCAVPNERYEVELPTGRVARGRLDQTGHARLEWFGAGGDCRIVFPGLDRSALGFVDTLGPR